MRKIQIYNTVFGIIILIYLISFILNLCGVQEFRFIVEYWFPIFLIVMGVLVVLRGLLFVSDTSLLSGIALCLSGITLLIKDIFNIPIYYCLPVLAGGISLTLLIIYLVFKNKLYLKSFYIAVLISALSCVGYVF